MTKFSFCVLISAVLLIVCAVAIAATPGVQLSKPVSCWPSDEVFRTLHGPDLNETVIWTASSAAPGVEHAPRVALTVNTRTWTLLEFDGVQACVLGAGTGYTAPRESPSAGVTL